MYGFNSTEAILKGKHTSLCVCVCVPVLGSKDVCVKQYVKHWQLLWRCISADGDLQPGSFHKTEKAWCPWWLKKNRIIQIKCLTVNSQVNSETLRSTLSNRLKKHRKYLECNPELRLWKSNHSLWVQASVAATVWGNLYKQVYVIYKQWVNDYNVLFINEQKFVPQNKLVPYYDQVFSAKGCDPGLLKFHKLRCNDIAITFWSVA